MSAAKHTAGPWMVYAEMGKCVVTSGELHDNPKSRMICECYVDGEEQDAEDEANAHLIAAVPCMKSSLADCLAEIDAEIEQRKTGGNDEDWAALQKISDAGHAALLKSTAT